MKRAKMGNLQSKKQVKRLKRQQKYNPTELSRPEGDLFNQKQKEQIALTSHFISNQTLALGNFAQKRTPKLELDKWPEFQKYSKETRPIYQRSVTPSQFTQIDYQSDLRNDFYNQDESGYNPYQKELQPKVSNMITSSTNKSYQRRLTKDLTNQIGNLTDGPGVLTQKTASTGPFKTFIFDNWTNTLRKVGVNPLLLKKQPNLLEPHQQYRLNVEITKEVKKYKQQIDLKLERSQSRNDNSLHSVSTLQDREVKQFQMQSRRKTEFFKKIKQDLPNFIRKTINQIYTKKQQNTGDSSLLKNIYGRKSEKQQNNQEEKLKYKLLLQSKAEERRNDFVQFFKDTILRKPVSKNYQTFDKSVRNKKKQKRIVPNIKAHLRKEFYMYSS